MFAVFSSASFFLPGLPRLVELGVTGRRRVEPALGLVRQVLLVGADNEIVVLVADGGNLGVFLFLVDHAPAMGGAGDGIGNALGVELDNGVLVSAGHRCLSVLVSGCTIRGRDRGPPS
jgi:hypothetical protein